MSLPQNSNWPLVAEQRLQLRQHVRIHPQEYRGERWYVLHDVSKGRHIRFNASAYEFIARLDGDISVQQIWELLVQIQDNTLDQDEVMMILTQLFSIDVLKGDLPADTTHFFQRYQHERHLRRKRSMMNPLAIRIPLFDPDRLLNLLMPWVRPVFTRSFLFLWLLLVGTASLSAMINFTPIIASMEKDILAPENIILMLLMFVLIKLVHEFSHGFAVKMWGGEVHEMGITLLVLAPVPYLDASAAWGFRDKYKRVLVGAAGIIAELFLAALALFVWLVVEPGMIKDAAFNAILICSVSTLLFNANPLLRFDGYYVLQDLIEIPNLYSRASRYHLYLIQRYLFGLDKVTSPARAEGERSWFFFYGLAAFIYRLFIMVVIILFLAEEYLFIGVALSLWMVFMQLIMPIIRGIRFLFASEILKGRRCRAAIVSILVIANVVSGLLYIQVPLVTRAEGVIWVPDQSQVFAATEGFVSEELVTSGDHVEADMTLLQMSEPNSEARIKVLEARYRELEILWAADQVEQIVQSEITREDMRQVKDEMKLLHEKKSELSVNSKVAGTFVLPNGSSLQGQYLTKGQLIGYIVSPERLIVRSVVPQASIGLLREQVEKVEVRLAERLGETIASSILRETPSASTNLPSRALGASGGGDIAIVASDEAGTTASEKVFQIDLSLPDDLQITGLGERVYILFDHGSESLARQWLRSGRQLVLSRLSL